MNADGSNRSVLFEDAEKSAVAPVWSPKGDKIAFGLGRFFQMRRRPGGRRYRRDRRSDGKGLKVLTDGQGEQRLPQLGPRRATPRLPLLGRQVELVGHSRHRDGRSEGVEDRPPPATTSPPGRRRAISSPSPVTWMGITRSARSNRTAPSSNASRIRRATTRIAPGRPTASGSRSRARGDGSTTRRHCTRSTASLTARFTSCGPTARTSAS